MTDKQTNSHFLVFVCMQTDISAKKGKLSKSASMVVVYLS